MPLNNDPRVKEYVDWAVRGVVAALLATIVAMAQWAFNTEQRVHDLEATLGAAQGRISVLEAKEDGYQQLQTDIAVIHAQLDGQDIRYANIERLLTHLAGR